MKRSVPPPYDVWTAPVQDYDTLVRSLNRMLAGHDFSEGIRAAIIDKGSTPQWRPASLDAVKNADVDAYFASLGVGELKL